MPFRFLTTAPWTWHGYKLNSYRISNSTNFSPKAAHFLTLLRSWRFALFSVLAFSLSSSILLQTSSCYVFNLRHPERSATMFLHERNTVLRFKISLKVSLNLRKGRPTLLELSASSSLRSAFTGRSSGMQARQSISDKSDLNSCGIRNLRIIKRSQMIFMNQYHRAQYLLVTFSFYVWICMPPFYFVGLLNS